MGEAIGQSLSLAVGIALSPVPTEPPAYPTVQAAVDALNNTPSTRTS